MEEFPDGASLKYTVGKRYSPSGKNIDKIGITPDISIEFNTTGYRETSLDNQLEKAKEVITHL
jgi:carboxyl-terminal processing protease